MAPRDQPHVLLHYESLDPDWLPDSTRWLTGGWLLVSYDDLFPLGSTLDWAS